MSNEKKDLRGLSNKELLARRAELEAKLEGATAAAEKLSTQLSSKANSPKERHGAGPGFVRMGTLNIDSAKPTAAEVEEVSREIENTLKEFPKETREEIKAGIGNFGYILEAKKNNFFAQMCDTIASEKDSKGTLTRFSKALKNIFVKDEKKALDTARKIAEGKEKKNLRNLGVLSGNLIKFGRMATDAFGITATSAFRSWMMLGMAGARLAEAGKEARLANERVIGKTRHGKEDMKLEDNTMANEIARAQEEAFAIYNSEKENLSSAEIQERYIQRLPEDILRRLEVPSAGNSFIQEALKGVIKLRLTVMASRVAAEGKLSKKLTEAQIAERVIKANEAILQDYDRIITQYGTVDALAMGARLAQTTGKAIVGVMGVLSVKKLLDNATHIFATSQTPLDQAHYPLGGPNAKISAIPEPITEQEVTSQSRAKGGPSAAKIMSFMHRMRESGAAHDDMEAGVQQNTSEVTPTPQPGPQPTPSGLASKIEPLASHGPSVQPQPAPAPGAPDSSYLKSDLGKVEAQFSGSGASAKATEGLAEFKSEPITFDKGEGGIKGVVDLKAQVRDQVMKQYGEVSKAPADVQKFLNTNATQLAKEFGFLDLNPNSPNESALIHEGSTLRFENGKIIFHDAKTNTDVVGKYTGEMFDSDKSGVAKAVEAASTTPASSLPENTIGQSGFENVSENIRFDEATPGPRSNIVFSEERFKEGLMKAYDAHGGGTPNAGEVKMSQEESGIRTMVKEFLATGSKGAEAQAATEVYRYNLRGLFPGEELNKWQESFSKLKARDILKEVTRGEGELKNETTYGHFYYYIKRLQEVTGLKPGGRGIFWGAESTENYIKRALKFAAKERTLDKVIMRIG